MPKVAYLTVRISVVLLNRLKHATIDQRTTQTALVQQAISEYLDRLDANKGPQ